MCAARAARRDPLRPVCRSESDVCRSCRVTVWSSLAIATAYAAYDVHSAKGSGIANRAAASFHFARLIISSAALLLLVPLRHHSESSPT